MLNDGTRYFSYDDENQLTSVTVSNAWRSEFVYDGNMRRRIRREYTWAASAWVKTNEVRYVYDGNLPIQERDINNFPAISYTRGRDLSGSFQGAGGIGGLLARTDHHLLAIGDTGAHAYYHADGNGNITALINASQCLVARYLYDPFGNVLSQSGPLAGVNLYQFSSKEFHANSGLSYYLYRFYDPNLQRWPNQDPIQEEGGLNLYAYVANNPINFYDPYGLAIGDWWDARTWFNSGFTESWSDQANSIGKTWGDVLAGNWDDIGNNYDDSTLGQAEKAGPGVHRATKVCVGTATAAAAAAAALMAAEAAGISDIGSANMGWKGGEITFTRPGAPTPDWRINPERGQLRRLSNFADSGTDG